MLPDTYPLTKAVEAAEDSLNDHAFTVGLACLTEHRAPTFDEQAEHTTRLNALTTARAELAAAERQGTSWGRGEAAYKAQQYQRTLEGRGY